MSFESEYQLGAYSREPLGGSGALSQGAYGGGAGANYRRKEEAYGRAVRQLRRRSRRGDTGAALEEIRVRDQAAAQGFTNPGGIRNREEFQAGLGGSLARQEQEARDFADAEKRERTLHRRFQEALDGGGEDRRPGEGVTGFAPATPGDPDGRYRLPREIRGHGTTGPGLERRLGETGPDADYGGELGSRGVAGDAGVAGQPSSKLGLAQNGQSLQTTTQGAGRGRKLNRGGYSGRRKLYEPRNGG